MSRHASPHFPSTRWTLIAKATRGGEEGHRALGTLLTRYLAPMRAYLVLEKRVPSDRAGDILQAFLADKVLGRGMLAAADPKKGKFRTYLLTALGRFADEQVRSAKRQKRSPAEMTATLDEALAEPTDAPTPAEAFDIAWARQVLDQAVGAMREECQRDGRPELWGVFEARVLGPTLEGAAPVPYDELAAQFRLLSTSAASNLLVTAKRMYVRHLRAVIAEYESDEAMIDAEITELKAILALGRKGK